MFMSVWYKYTAIKDVLRIILNMTLKQQVLDGGTDEIYTAICWVMQ
jgi:hypothetical protein